MRMVRASADATTEGDNRLRSVRRKAELTVNLEIATDALYRERLKMEGEGATCEPELLTAYATLWRIINRRQADWCAAEADNGQG